MPPYEEPEYEDYEDPEEVISLNKIRELMNQEWHIYQQIYQEAAQYAGSQDDSEFLLYQKNDESRKRKDKVLSKLEKFCNLLGQLNESSVRLATYIDLVRTHSTEPVPEEIIDTVNEVEDFRVYSYDNLTRLLIKNMAELVETNQRYVDIKRKLAELKGKKQEPNAGPNSNTPEQTH